MSRVYIGRLSYQAREKDIERFFKNYGHIREINLKNGFGFVEFDDRRDAEDAVYDLNNRELCGERVIIEHARGPARGRDDRYGGNDSRGGGGGRGGSERRPGWIDKYGPPVRTDYRVIVDNLSSRVSWQDLKDYMRQAGEVTFADAHKQRKNEGIVEFNNLTDMTNAIKKLNGTELSGRHIKITEDTPRKKRSYTRSRSPRSRSRSRSPRRSRSRSPRHSRSRRSRSGSRSRSRSRSRDRKSNSKSRSRSKSPRRSHSKSPRCSVSPRKSKSRSRSRSHSRRSRSRSHSHSRRSRSHSHSRRSRSHSHSHSKSRSHSPCD